MSTFKSTLAAAILIAFASPTLADQVIRPAGPPIVIQAGSGLAVKLPKRPSQVFSADPEIANIQYQPIEGQPNDTLFILAKKPGSTSLLALDDEGRVMFGRTVNVPTRDVKVMRGGRTSVWTPDTGDSSRNSATSASPTIADLPAGSSVTVPVGTK